MLANDVARLLERRRAAVAQAWELRDEVVLIGAGEEIPIPGGADQTYPFWAHPDYYYLTDRNRPGGVLAFDPASGWEDFVRPLTTAERLWSAGLADSDSGSDPAMGRPLPELSDWLRERGDRPRVGLGVAPPGEPSDAGFVEELTLALAVVRRPKDELELERMRAAGRATAAGFAAAVSLLRPGTTEREVQIAFEATALRNGADAMAYPTIVGGGPNSAILHGTPGARALREGDLVLIDAGAGVRHYACDVTRTYPVGGSLTGIQREIHGLVHGVERAAIERCRPGAEWRDVHLASARMLAEGLVSLDILRGGVDTLIESGAVWLFFPHGIGHLVGLGIRDATGPLPDRRDAPRPFPTLRIDLPLRPGMVVTVEPGIYFVAALLDDAQTRHALREEVNWPRVDELADFGGIRIEDNVLVTADGPVVLTSEIPVLD